MKIYVALSLFNGDGSSASISVVDEYDFEDTVSIVEGFTYSPQETCRRAAKELRKAAAKFDLLAKEKRCSIYKSTTHDRINNAKLPTNSK